MAEFRMPSLGSDMEAGTLIEWLVKPGDRVKHGDIVAVVETQKGAIEIEIFETGEIEQFLVDIGTKVPVGTPLAKIRTEQEVKAGTNVKPAQEALVIAPSPTIPIAPYPTCASHVSSVPTAHDRPHASISGRAPACSIAQRQPRSRLGKWPRWSNHLQRYRVPILGCHGSRGTEIPQSPRPRCNARGDRSRHGTFEA